MTQQKAHCVRILLVHATVDGIQQVKRVSVLPGSKLLYAVSDRGFDNAGGLFWFVQ
jgi:hypothetical protein